VKVAAPVDTAALQQRRQANRPSSLNADLTGVPILHAAPNTASASVVQSTTTPEPSVEAHPIAQAAYDAQAKTLPLPRRRSIPAFLLDGQEPEQAEPYTLVSKKQLLEPHDDLMQAVVPLDAPAPNAPPEKSPIPAFMRTSKPKPSRKPLLGNLLFGKKPVQYPEMAFGLTARAQKQLELPGSLNRLMQTLDHHPAAIDS
jgi:hypothetical protein